jgi:hypothetical protein
MRKKKKDSLSRHEGIVSEMLLGDFRPEKSRAIKFLEKMAPNVSLTRDSLIMLGEMCSAITKIDFPRNSKRRRSLIIKWFDDHLADVQPLAHLLRLDLRAKGGDTKSSLEIPTEPVEEAGQ